MKITPTVILAAITLTATVARAEVGYVDLNRAVIESDDGKKLNTELQAQAAARDRAKAEAAKPKEKGAKPAPAVATDEQWKNYVESKSNAMGDQAVDRFRRIFPAILKARKLTALAPISSMVYVPPALDVTEELIRRYNAGEGKDRTAEVAAAKAKLEALEREVKGSAPK
jgi:Skp family chaperone for outer membrane proteins